MRLKVLIYTVFTLAFIACNDDLSPVGMSIQPDEDKINVYTDTIPFTSSTQIVDSVFIKTVAGCLGSFDDPTYGNIKYGYMCNFYTSPDSVFRSDVIDNKIDSVILYLSYRSYIGDSLTPMEATVYEVIKPLEKNFYSNVDPWKYADKNSIFGKQTYTARDMSIPDSLNYIYKVIKIPLSVSIGERIYKEWREGGKETFNDLNKFFTFFPGIYIESTYGSGNVLDIGSTDFFVYYTTHYKRNTTELVDSVGVASTLFAATEEVTQLNKFESKFGNQELINNKEYTYLKTPAGVVTQLEIPLQDIVNKIGTDRNFNNVKLTLEVEEQPNIWGYTMSIPREVVLMSPDSIKPFFEKSRYANSRYSYYTTLATSSAYKYDFGNISTLIQNSITSTLESGGELKPLKLWIIPVETNAGDPSILSGITKNYFKPSGARLKTGPQNLRLYITTTKTNK